MEEVYIVGGYRTPIGKTGGILKNFLPEKLAAAVLNGIIGKYGLNPTDIDEVILGNAVGPGGNIARVSVLEARWPFHIPGLTIDFQCGSGLAAINMAAAKIMAKQGEVVIAGGVESTTMSPKRQFNKNDPRFKGQDHFYERAPFSTPEIGDPEMGEGAEKVASIKKISREAMDQWALSSHRKAMKALEEGVLSEIILPLKDGETLISQDESIRCNISEKLLRRMPPVFLENGKVTAGNACLKHDGAAAILLASAEAIAKYGLRPEAKIIAMDYTGYDPNIFPLSPVPSILNILAKTRLSINEFEAIEINEAFAVKVLACCQELGVDMTRVNMLGGALAYGHPYGASGAIILLHLLRSLAKVKGKLGIASIGVVGGQGVSIAIERCEDNDNP